MEDDHRGNKHIKCLTKITEMLCVFYEMRTSLFKAKLLHKMKTALLKPTSMAAEFEDSCKKTQECFLFNIMKCSSGKHQLYAKVTNQ
jgi:hypothetical protein